MSQSHITEDDTIDFCTLGMFIIDEVRPPPPLTPIPGQVGGAGAYAAIGARLLSPTPLSQRVGWIVDKGSDFPSDLQRVIDSWETHCEFRDTPDRLTTRGIVEYNEHQQQIFSYTNPPLRLHADSLTERLLQAKSFHMICSAGRCIEIVEGVLARRRTECPELRRPLFVWEPFPASCTPEQREQCLEAMSYVDVVSPNHDELAAFFGRNGTHSDGSIDVDVMDSCLHEFLKRGVGPECDGAVVVRCSKYGCRVVKREGSRWMPAYHDAQPERVVDPTGGGNSFMGGLAVGLVRGGSSTHLENIFNAAIWGSIAASFCIEQLGMPTLDPREKKKHSTETWNGTNVDNRVIEFEKRLATYIQP